jgi:hypothetical protein
MTAQRELVFGLAQVLFVESLFSRNWPGPPGGISDAT